MWRNPQEIADLVRFTEKILNGKLDFLCSEIKVVLCFEIFLFKAYKHLQVISK